MIKIDSNTGICPECHSDTRQMRRVLTRKKPHPEDTMTLDDVTLILKGCEKCRTVFYREYRKRTGKCETCGIRIISHIKCSACGLLIGPGHYHIDFIREINAKLCPDCLIQWQKIPIDIMFHHAFKKFCLGHGKPLEINKTGYKVWMKGAKAKAWAEALIDKELKSLN